VKRRPNPLPSPLLYCGGGRELRQGCVDHRRERRGNSCEPNVASRGLATGCLAHLHPCSAHRLAGQVGTGRDDAGEARDCHIDLCHSPAKKSPQIVGGLGWAWCRYGVDPGRLGEPSVCQCPRVGACCHSGSPPSICDILPPRSDLLLLATVFFHPPGHLPESLSGLTSSLGVRRDARALNCAVLVGQHEVEVWRRSMAPLQQRGPSVRVVTRYNKAVKHGGNEPRMQPEEKQQSLFCFFVFFVFCLLFLLFFCFLFFLFFVFCLLFLGYRREDK